MKAVLSDRALAAIENLAGQQCAACGSVVPDDGVPFECVANPGQPCSVTPMSVKGHCQNCGTWMGYTKETNKCKVTGKPCVSDTVQPFAAPIATGPTGTAVDAVLRETEWQSMRDLARVAVRSGVLPGWITTEEKAQTVIAIGRELGVGPMTSLRLISLTDDGKIIMEAHLIRALVLRRIPGSRMDVIELTAEKCRITCSRPNHETRTYEWTILDSQRAGLSDKKNHQRYPKSMNLARATTLSAAAYFGDADCGIYTPEDFAGFAESESDRKDRVEAARASASKAVELAAESGAIDPKVADQLRKLGATSQDDRKLATVEKKAAEKVATLEKEIAVTAAAKAAGESAAAHKVALLEKNMAVAKAAEEGREDGRKAAAVTT